MWSYPLLLGWSHSCGACPVLAARVILRTWTFLAFTSPIKWTLARCAAWGRTNYCPPWRMVTAVRLERVHYIDYAPEHAHLIRLASLSAMY